MIDPAWLQEEDPDDVRAEEGGYCLECGWPSPDRDGLCRICLQYLDDDGADVARWEAEEAAVMIGANDERIPR